MNARIRIGQFIDTDVPGGAEVIMLNLSKLLLKKGYSVVIMHFGHPWLEKLCRINNIESIILTGERYYKSIKLLPIFILIFAKILKKNNIDILHSHLFGPVTAGALSSKLANIKHIGTFHDIYTIQNSKHRILLVKIALHLKTKIVVVSQNMKSVYDRIGKFDSRVIETIHNGVDTSIFNEMAKSDSCNGEFGRSKINFICSGRLVGLKRHIYLIEAFKNIRQELRDKAKLLLIGDGELKGTIEKYIIENNLEKDVTLLGFRGDIPCLLQQGDCFVLASSTEGLSCSIQEAMASGLPIVATDVGGNSELVRSNYNGVLVDPDNQKELTAALEKIIDDSKSRILYGKNSKKLIEKSFSLNEMVLKYERLYLRALS